MIILQAKTPEEYKPYTPVDQVTMEIDHGASLDEMLEAYQSFLGAIGYHIEGAIVVEPLDE